MILINVSKKNFLFYFIKKKNSIKKKAKPNQKKMASQKTPEQLQIFYVSKLLDKNGFYGAFRFLVNLKLAKEGEYPDDFDLKSQESYQYLVNNPLSQKEIMEIENAWIKYDQEKY